MRVMQNKLEGMIYTNDKVFKEFGKLLSEDDRNRVGKILARAKEAAGDEDKQQINDAIFELQAAARILTSVMLYNPLKSTAPSNDPTPSVPSEK
jgi:molecular chaperone DnaK (HSP70)